jgi:hypothetical protein
MVEDLLLFASLGQTQKQLVGGPSFTTSCCLGSRYREQSHRSEVKNRSLQYVDVNDTMYVDEGIIFNITVDKYDNPCFFQQKCIKDLGYSGINTNAVGRWHIRRLKDAILLRAEQAVWATYWQSWIQIREIFKFFLLTLI